MRGSRAKWNRSRSASTGGCGARRVPRSRRTITAYPRIKYAASSAIPTAQISKMGLTAPAFSVCTVAVSAACVRAGNGMAAPVLPVCAASAPRSRFQTLQRVGISIGSSRRTAAAHQSAGNSRRGRCFFSASRSARTSRIIALPPSMAACIPFMPRIPPPACAAARPLPSRADDPTGSTQTAAPPNRRTPCPAANRPPPSAPVPW